LFKQNQSYQLIHRRKTAFLLIFLKAEHLYQTLFLFWKQEFPIIQTGPKPFSVE